MRKRHTLARRLLLLAIVAVPVLAGSVWWSPALLRRTPWTQVRRVEVVGTIYVAPDSVLAAARIRPAASVFDDFQSAEARIAEHPLIRRARIGPRGWRTLRIEVEELVAVALAPVPELHPVMGDGTVLPIDPARTRVDLPILNVPVAVREGRVVEGEGRRVLEAFAHVHARNPGLAAIVAEVRPAPGGGIALSLLESREAAEIWLPAEPDEATLRRVRATLVDLRRRRWTVQRLEARFVGQVVVQRNPSLKAS
jgi:hypothetical protein